MAALRRACTWLSRRTLPGVHTVLKRLKIIWKRARSAIRSPDPDYDAKLADVAAVLAAARAAPARIVTVYLDEVTVEQQPTLANAYAPAGHAQALAHRSQHAHTDTRVVGALDPLTGRVVYRRATKITLACLIQFYQALRAAYP